MYAKIALRSARRSARDYLIYLLTLMLTVGLFYSFLSIISPFYLRKLPLQINLDYFGRYMRIIIPLLSLLIIFLMKYVNRFMLRRRQKEMALQMVMGMERGTCAWVFFSNCCLWAVLR